MSDHDIDYFNRRAQEERARASECNDPAARQAHLEFARHYEALLREGHAQSPPIQRTRWGRD